MNDELRATYNDDYDVMGYPQNYKNIKIYPIKVCDVDQISLFYKLMTIPKDTIQDKKIRKMSYLKYLYIYYGQYNKDLIDALENEIKKFLSYILQKNTIDIYAQMNGDKIADDFSNLSMTIKADNIELNENDFENIREIVLEQNGFSIEYINDFVPDLEQKLIWMMKDSNLNFRDQVFTFASMMSKSPKEIGEFTLFQLFDMLDRKVAEKNYDIYEPLIKSGQVTNNGEKIQSYLFHRAKKRRYDSIFMSPEEFNKIEAGLTDSSTIK